MREDYENQDLITVPGIVEITEKSPVTFINGDNMQYLRWLKDNMKYKHFAVGIVDPPYGIGVGSMNLGATKDSPKKEFKTGSWDNGVPTSEYWELLEYCCMNLIVWGGNYFSNYIRPGRCFIVWDKMNDKMSFAAGELALTTFDKNAVIIRRARNASGVDDEKEKRHPTQKPVYLYDYLHLNFVNRDQRVLDTHGGSHTHAIAANKNNVKLTIVERDRSYFDSGIEAYDRACTKGRLLF